MNDTNSKKMAMGSGFLLFTGTDEKLVFETKGILNGTINGNLVLTDKKIFFYYMSNISRDKVFIATYPFLKSVKIKEGLLNSSLIIQNNNETFKINKINKKQAKDFYTILDQIISDKK